MNTTTKLGSDNTLYQAGIMEEMMEDTMDSVLDQDGVEEEAEDEVNKVLTELTSGTSIRRNSFYTLTPSRSLWRSERGGHVLARGSCCGGRSSIGGGTGCHEGSSGDAQVVSVRLLGRSLKH